MYTAVLAGPVAPFQPSRSLKPTPMDSDLHETTVTPESTGAYLAKCPGI
jgi:hypothetical protein